MTIEQSGIVIEKSFRTGGSVIGSLDYHVEYPAVPDTKTGGITFREQNN